MLMRYVGPLEEARISVAGNDFGTIKRGEAIVVPDELANSVEWSEHWENVKATKKAAKDAKDPLNGEVPVPSGVTEPGTADEGVSDSNVENPDVDENISTDNGNEESN